MKRLSLSILSVLIICYISGCIKPIDVEVDENEPVYVVEGMITDKVGAYEVKIRTSAAYTQNTEGTNYPVENAEVILYDDAGNTEVLRERPNGIYKTSGIQGVPGRTYHITIKTADGDRIESLPETMPYPAEIDTFYYQFIDESPIAKAGHVVHLVINDPPEVRNYYRWRWEGVYVFNTHFTFLAPCQIKCWRFEYDQDFLKVASDRLFNGNKVDQEIYRVPFFNLGKYLLTIEQYNLTGSAYEFWKLIDEQINKNGSVFDPPPSRIRGNLFHPDDPQKPVLGYFQASSLTKIPVLIRRTVDNSGGYRSGLYRRYYPENTCCGTLTNSVEFNVNPETWPEGWELD